MEFRRLVIPVEDRACLRTIAETEVREAEQQAMT
jgi:hypothetical protein